MCTQYELWQLYQFGHIRKFCALIQMEYHNMSSLERQIEYCNLSPPEQDGIDGLLLLGEKKIKECPSNTSPVQIFEHIYNITPTPYGIPKKLLEEVAQKCTKNKNYHSYKITKKVTRTNCPTPKKLQEKVVQNDKKKPLNQGLFA